MPFSSYLPMNNHFVANSMLSLDGLLEESREGFQVSPIGLAGMPSWHICDGALSHVSGGFFSVVGVRFEPSESGPGSDALYLYQPQSAFNGLLTCEIEGRERLQRDGVWGEGNITNLDGVRVDYPKGWGLVRASNTTPVLVLRFEAETEEELERIKEVFRAQLYSTVPDLDLPF